MSSLTQVPPGAPGIYAARPAIARSLAGVRMDVCAFVGVAPRGPSRVPVFDERWRDDVPCVESARPRRRTAAVAIDSFDEYRALFGGFEGPGLLPYAVAAFFANGGQRAWVARIVHDYGNPVLDAGRVPSATVSGALLLARNEGNWGKSITAQLSYATRPIAFLEASMDHVTFATGQPVTAGALLRLTFTDGTRVVRFVNSPERLGVDRSRWRATFDTPSPQVPDQIEIVEGELALDDGDLVFERHTALGLAPEHPRWMATVLCYESDLAWPHESWIAAPLPPTSAALEALVAVKFTHPDDCDDYAAIVHDDFFDAEWVLGNDEPGVGVHCLTHNSEIAQVVVPDLYSPGELAPLEPILDVRSFAGPEFAPCVPATPPGTQGSKPKDLEGLRLDPRIPSDRAQIIALQSRLVDLAEALRFFIVLLDVPPGLDQRAVKSWRAAFDSSYAAAYHPWAKVSRPDDDRDALILVPPSAFAAGTIANTELLFGIPHGPANRVLAGAVDVAERVSPARHDELHPMGINVVLRERDGIMLSAARTLSSDPQYRQLSVRRLMLMLRRTLDREMQWTVFEPNNASLRREVSQLLRSFLKRLFDQGAFAPSAPEQAYFVRCDESLNPSYVADAGRLVVEVGVAPSEPIEYIVLKIERAGDGSLRVEE